MTTPNDQQEDRDELELDSETVKDLEPNEQDADPVRGGAQGSSDWGGESSM